MIGGVSIQWRTGVGVQPGYLGVYNTFNMISPWAVGGFTNMIQAAAYKNVLAADLSYCTANNIDYQPVLWPGFAWSNWNTGTQNQIPRLHGDFMWQQFVNLKQLGIQNAYVAMFDEYNEGTAIAKAGRYLCVLKLRIFYLEKP